MAEQKAGRPGDYNLHTTKAAYRSYCTDCTVFKKYLSQDLNKNYQKFHCSARISVSDLSWNLDYPVQSHKTIKFYCQNASIATFTAQFLKNMKLKEISDSIFWAKAITLRMCERGGGKPREHFGLIFSWKVAPPTFEHLPLPLIYRRVFNSSITFLTQNYTIKLSIVCE